MLCILKDMLYIFKCTLREKFLGGVHLELLPPKVALRKRCLCILKDTLYIEKHVAVAYVERRERHVVYIERHVVCMYRNETLAKNDMVDVSMCVCVLCACACVCVCVCVFVCEQERN